MLKSELQSYTWVRRNIEKLEDKLLELETEATRQTTRFSKTPGSVSAKQDKMGDIVVKMVEVQEQINEQLQQGYAMMRRIEKAIASLPPREAYLIRARYIELKSWEQIAVDMNYSWQHIHRIHSEALKLLA